MWGMGKYPYMTPSFDEYLFLTHPKSKAVVSLKTVPERVLAGSPAQLQISLREVNGKPAQLLYDMDKLLHIAVISEDQTFFAHVHPDDEAPLTPENISESSFLRTITFPKAGKYLISFSYAHGMKLETQQFFIEAHGAIKQGNVVRYQSPGIFDGYEVSLAYGQLYANEPAVLQYTISREGKPVTDLRPYLAASMHVSVVKNDLSAFIHTHGEVHPPGVPIPPARIKYGQIVHVMSTMMTPDRFGPKIEAHVLFPSPGLYTVWGEFNDGKKVVPTAFTVRVEQ
jgi:Cu+-exporting ATPase